MRNPSEEMGVDSKSANPVTEGKIRCCGCFKVLGPDEDPTMFQNPGGKPLPFCKDCAVQYVDPEFEIAPGDADNTNESY